MISNVQVSKIYFSKLPLAYALGKRKELIRNNLAKQSDQDKERELLNVDTKANKRLLVFSLHSCSPGTSGEKTTSFSYTLQFLLHINIKIIKNTWVFDSNIVPPEFSNCMR